jgi:rod shape determining protein RodA
VASRIALPISDASARDRDSGSFGPGWTGYLHLDGILLSELALLSLFGLVSLYGAGHGHFTLVEKQLIRVLLGFAVLVAVAQVPPVYYRLAAPWFYAASLLLLTAVLVYGHTRLGAQRWLDLGFVRLEPTELMLLALPLMLTRHLSAAPPPPDWKRIGASLILIGLPLALILKQPDLGSALLIGLIGVFCLFLSGIRWRYLVIGLLLVAASTPVAWHFMHQYQRERILIFLNPERDPLGAGYHIIQSQIALGSGGLFGRGLLHGSQTQLDFLPESTTDFIFAVIGEQFGLLGAFALIFLFLLLVQRTLWLATRMDARFGRLWTVTLAFIIFLYLVVNVGMVSGLLPVVGEPLPFISFGGSSIVTLMAGFGSIMNLSREPRLTHSR